MLLMIAISGAAGAGRRSLTDRVRGRELSLATFDLTIGLRPSQRSSVVF
jgi:hypothetical protein